MTKRDGLHLLGEIRKGAAIAWDDTGILPEPIAANLRALFAQSRIQSKVARDEPIRTLPEPFAGPFICPAIDKPPELMKMRQPLPAPPDAGYEPIREIFQFPPEEFMFMAREHLKVYLSHGQKRST